ncbi:hypothetical protein BT63DRAFT_444687 [Microthyrium microscopicum]|uniref:Heterokaryon incompatibility domain-containing protein n=1 Tax=Microthyrium microscopicum TaxID=703497 RepID=A0A6A6TWN7_9PEZI|nr:hypothetical protein BT63DRAFT_444687 [Microthyrium microscopicum]
MAANQARNRLTPYSYNLCPLKNASREIRIMVIKEISKNGNDEVLQVELQSLDISTYHKIQAGSDVEPYYALSWCWRAYDGEDEVLQQLVPINILKNKSKYTFLLSSNLNAALKALYTLKIFRIWVDWVCIDQGDVAERSNQVRLMAQVYGKSEIVYVWLGEEKHGSKRAFKFIPKMLEVRGFNELVKDSHEDLKAVKMLLTRDWFSRRWIIQEIALADQAMLICGTDQLEWSKFAIAVSLFTEYETQTRGLSEVMKARVEYDNHPDYFGNLPSLSAAHLVEITNKLFRKRNNGHLDRLLSLEYLVSTFITFNSSEARDNVYAILAIAKDTTPQTVDQIDTVLKPLTLKNIEEKSKTFARILRQFAAQYLAAFTNSKPYNVDYDQPISDIYVEFVQFCIERARQQEPTRALDILCRPWAPDPDFPDEADSNPHWRVKFTWKKSYNNKPEETETGEQVPQSSRAKKKGNNAPEADMNTDPIRSGGTNVTSEVTTASKVQDGQEDQDTIPSWVRSKELFSHGCEREGEGNIKMTRRNPDSLVGNPSQYLYSASGSRGVTKNLRFQDGRIEAPGKPEHNHHYHSIFVEGFVLGTVAELGERSQKGVIPKTWATLCRRHAKPTRTPTRFWELSRSNDFWRTLIADQSWTGRDPPRFYQHILQSRYAGDIDVDLSDLTQYNKLKCEPAKDVSQRVQAVIWDRVLMIVDCKTRQSTGQNMQDDDPVLGLAPYQTKADDLVCILYGCSVPIILRQYDKSESVLKAQEKEREKELQLKAYNMFANAYFRSRCIAVKDDYIRKEMVPPSTSRARQSTPSISKAPASSSGKRKRSSQDGIHQPDTSNKRRTRADTRERSVLTSPTPTPEDASSRGYGPPRQEKPPLDDKADFNRPLSEPKKFYKMIGECYVHGMMHGEAIEHQNVERLPKVIFEIR